MSFFAVKEERFEDEFDFLNRLGGFIFFGSSRCI
jgi:hypothetical protein